MERVMSRKFTGVAVAALVLAAAGPAAASGRCGGSLSVDRPTTLKEVASRCNVSVAALREANPGVDPASVSPGNHLAIPDEIDPYVAAYDAGAVPANGDGPHDGHAGDDASADALGYDGRISSRVRLRNLRLASADPVWSREATGGGGRSFASDRLSYQQRAALRIHNAGVPTFAAPAGAAMTISAPIDLGADAAPAVSGGDNVVACSVLKQDENGAFRKVTKVVTAPPHTAVDVGIVPASGADCRTIKAKAAPSAEATPPSGKIGSLYRLPDYNAINPTSARPTPLMAPISMSAKGTVVGSDKGCLILQSDAGGRWALAAAPGGESLVGKHLTAWGAASASGACGDAPTLVVSHAVYADPWK